MNWKFVWIGKVRNRKQVVKFAFKNLWNAFKGYELTIQYDYDNNTSMVKPAL